MTNTEAPAAASDAVARTILEQIGRGTRMELAARDFLYSNEALWLTITADNRRRIRVTITLTADDLYRVRWLLLADLFGTPSEVSGLYADHLPQVLRDIAAGTTAGWTR